MTSFEDYMAEMWQIAPDSDSQIFTAENMHDAWQAGWDAATDYLARGGSFK